MSDYCSPKVCADLITVVPDSYFDIDHALVIIAAMRAMHIESGSASEHYLSIMVCDPVPTNLAKLDEDRRLQAVAAALKVSLHVVPDGAAAAAIIADLEFGPMK
jgi:hypothetical protein